MSEAEKVAIPEEFSRWEQAACGRHSNRYCEDDDVWDACCVYCTRNYQRLKERDERIAKAEARIADLTSQQREWLKANGPAGWIDDLRVQLAAMRAPVSEGEFDEHFHMQYGSSRDVATVQEVNALLAARFQRTTDAQKGGEGGK